MKVFNQNIFNDFANDCAPVTLFQILRSKFWIDSKYRVINKMIDYFLEIKVLFLWGAVFRDIYKAFCEKVNKTMWINIKIKQVDLTSPSLRENDFYGIWLRRWNQSYLRAIKKGYLDIDDIDIIYNNIEWWFNHNLCYWRWELQEVMKWVSIKCSIGVLQYGIEKEVFWSIWRTITHADDFTEKVLEYLQQMAFDKNSEIIIKNKEDEKALNKASEIHYRFECGWQ